MSLDPYRGTNAAVREFADAHRLKRMKLGDGEVVIRLRGLGGFASLENATTWGFYCPRTRPRLAVDAAHRCLSATQEARSDLSSDSEAYFRVSWLSGCLLLTQAGGWFSARRKRPAPKHLPRMAG